MRIDVYADVVCPWCYIGEKRLEEARASRPDVEVERSWKPFQLRPEMPAGGSPWRAFAIEKFGGEERMRAAFAQVATAGAPQGILFDFDRVASAPNTVDAHRLILFAAERGRQWETVNALFRGYFSEGRDLNDPEDLCACAAEAGLGTQETLARLADDANVGEVWASQREAVRLGISSVPFYVIDGRYAISGGQPAETWVRAFDAVETT